MRFALAVLIDPSYLFRNRRLFRARLIRLVRPSETRDGFLKFKQQKTGKDIEIPILPELRSALDAFPSERLTHLVTEHAKPYSPAGFGNRFRDWCNQAVFLNARHVTFGWPRQRELSHLFYIRIWQPWRSLGDSNPCSSRERAVSWATRRREPCFRRAPAIESGPGAHHLPYPGEGLKAILT